MQVLVMHSLKKDTKHGTTNTQTIMHVYIFNTLYQTTRKINNTEFGGIDLQLLMVKEFQKLLMYN